MPLPRTHALISEDSRQDVLDLNSVPERQQTPLLFDGDPPYLNVLTSVDRTDYDALSYTWQCPSNKPELAAQYSRNHDVTVTVTTDGRDQHETRIGRNLYEALQQIWLTGRRRFIWVDALCIRQDDLQEKEKHLNLMHHIYPRAKLVIAWPGVDDRQQPTFADVIWFSGVSRILVNTTSLEIAQGHGSAERNVRGVECKGTDLFLPAAVLHSWYRFCSYTSYFSRAWVLQEVSLCNDVVILLGNRYVNLWLLFSIIQTLSKHREGVRMFWKQNPASGGNGNELWGMGQHAFDRYNRQYHGRTSNRLEEYIYCMTEGSRDPTVIHLAHLQLELGSGYRRGCSDPRDEIYCLLGYVSAMAPVHSLLLAPNYSKDVVDTYKKVTTLLLEKLPHRSVLSLVRQRTVTTTNQHYINDLPSWVPDFHTCRESNRCLFDWAGQVTRGRTGWSGYRAALGDANTEWSVRDRKLKLYARRVGRIVHCEQPFFLDWSAEPEWWHAMYECTRGELIPMLKLCLAWTTSSNAESNRATLETIYRLLTTDIRPNADLTTDSLLLAAAAHVICNTVYLAALLYRNHGEGISTPLRAVFDETMALITQLHRRHSFPNKEDYEFLDRVITVMKLGGWQETVAKVQTSPEMSSQQRSEAHRVLIEDDQKWQAMQNGMLEMERHKDDCFFQLETGHMGKATWGARQGDEVWLICGTRVPFILRHTRKPDHFTFLGETLVQGAMEGQLLRNGVAGKAQQIKLV